MTGPGTDDGPHGVVLDEHDLPTGPSVVTIAAAIGSVWGLLCYSILWEGQPVEVQRRFVESAIGTVALLPVRVVLWAIHLAEDLAGRTFELSANHRWIGVVAAIVGALIVGGIALVVRASLRRLRRPAAEDPIRG